jgi:hypothetical protein
MKELGRNSKDLGEIPKQIVPLAEAIPVIRIWVKPQSLAADNCKLQYANVIPVKTCPKEEGIGDPDNT